MANYNIVGVCGQRVTPLDIDNISQVKLQSTFCDNDDPNADILSGLFCSDNISIH